MPSGGWRNGGRPKGSVSKKPTRSISQHIRWTVEEWEQITAVAGKSASDFCRKAIISELERRRK